MSAPDFYCDEVISGRTEVSVVNETASVLAFHHTRPSFETHVVVIPKRHVASLIEADDRIMAQLMAVVRTIARAIVEERGACRIETNLGALQASPHLHWHLVAGTRLGTDSGNG